VWASSLGFRRGVNNLSPLKFNKLKNGIKIPECGLNFFKLRGRKFEGPAN
jgi:hypothetical protein